ncbi:sugar phosphate isomerase/epimerase family protein [Hoeflea prorocentri]|uniref:Sugar phosphate isomerase/epimerase n=1 Tax=Hoeflea prorocentri TaxID=1922333 RepID=A0A9X3UQB4_9HYPH|nr:sugar phosphate isomerase/epimerase family protein [Hoeflea prorocentri]MCY6383241.1 sugar phosphate isomerase/epimerase [Hoeflea prorocentri]MDA5401041.1 sugar phosphate isomerase/epimerase [Hoeflea prorocentri]
MEQVQKDIPVLGAALTLRTASHLKEWLFESDRDLEIQDFVLPQLLNGNWQAIAGEYKKLLDGYRGRVGIHGPFYGFDIASNDPEIQAIIEKRLLQGLSVCEALGATHMVVHSPFTLWQHNNFGDDPGSRERLIGHCHVTMKEAVRRAESIGCVLVIENVEDVDPRERGLLADSFDSEAVQISLDTGHAHSTGGAPPVDYFVEAAGHRLAHVHIQDTDAYADRHWLPGDGTISWRAFFDALRVHADNPRLIIEVGSALQERIPACVRRLESEGLAR